jgi:hypothetical protein
VGLQIRDQPHALAFFATIGLKVALNNEEKTITEREKSLLDVGSLM